MLAQTGGEGGAWGGVGECLQQLTNLVAPTFCLYAILSLYVLTFKYFRDKTEES